MLNYFYADHVPFFISGSSRASLTTVPIFFLLSGHHLEKELRGNKLFNGLMVSAAVNESDDSKVCSSFFNTTVVHVAHQIFYKFAAL